MPFCKERAGTEKKIPLEKKILQEKLMDKIQENQVKIIKSGRDTVDKPTSPTEPPLQKQVQCFQGQHLRQYFHQQKDYNHSSRGRDTAPHTNQHLQTKNNSGRRQMNYNAETSTTLF